MLALILIYFTLNREKYFFKYFCYQTIKSITVLMNHGNKNKTDRFKNYILVNKVI